MKCPKCGYLGLEDVERCRNCGYDFSLAFVDPLPEVSIRQESPGNPLDDLMLSGGSESIPSPLGSSDESIHGLRLTVAEPASELPLFGGPQNDDVPLITKASPPRPPLAVRRATPEVPRLKAEAPRTPMLDLEPPPPAVATGPRGHVERLEPPGIEDAALGARFVAMAIDLLILAVVDLVVVYLTMQICSLTVSDLGILPKGPLAAFLMVQNGGYLIAFTAGGQTLGQMAAGIRVIPSEDEATLDLGRAALRTLVWFVLAVPAGLGFLTALFSRDHRGLHDRFSGTRVVRAV